MQIGELNKRITLQYQTKTSDGMGGNTVVWTDDRTVWAAVWPLSGSEYVKSMQNSAEINGRIRIRYYSSVKSHWRIKFGNRYLNIISIINPNEKNEYMDLMYKEAV